MRELKDAGEQLKSEGEKFGEDVKQVHQRAQQELGTEIRPDADDGESAKP